jgi:tyrosyl-tRNA synthetase
VGDPTGRSETRSRLTHEKVKENAQTYLDQFFKIVDRERAEVAWNGDWFSKLTFTQVMELASRFTVARLLERDDFETRYREGRPISLHEFFYPIMQGYDSVMVRADVELGGTDQKFNLLMGRTLQEAHGQEPQAIITLPILEGLDGVQRMSKSLGNYVGIQESPREMFGKIMSIPDALIARYYLLCTDRGPGIDAEIRRRLSDPGVNPRDMKAELAGEIVSLYHSREAAQAASLEFDRMFRQGEAPDEMPLVEAVGEGEDLLLIKVLADHGLVKSRAEARRLVRQGAVKVDGERVVEEQRVLEAREEPYQVQVGRRTWARIRAREPHGTHR